METVLLELTKESLSSIKSSFAKLLEVNNDKCLEIEARLGVILDRKTGTRIDLGAAHPVIFMSQKSEFYFQSGVTSPFFQKVNQNLSCLKSSRIEEVVIIKNKVRTIYSDGKKTIMRKVRLRTFEIHFPSCRYDVRISFSKEELLNREEEMRIVKKKVEGFRRERDRISMSASSYKFDLTSIKSSNQFIYEIEVEITDFDFDRNEFFNILENLAR